MAEILLLEAGSSPMELNPQAKIQQDQLTYECLT
jgi:hypothetical protein